MVILLLAAVSLVRVLARVTLLGPALLGRALVSPVEDAGSPRLYDE